MSTIGTEQIENGLLVAPFTGLPLRRGSSSAPLHEGDFCPCARGREARRWFLAGYRPMRSLCGLFPACRWCNPATGIVEYGGWVDVDGVVLCPFRVEWPGTASDVRWGIVR